MSAEMLFSTQMDLFQGNGKKDKGVGVTDPSMIMVISDSPLEEFSVLSPVITTFGLVAVPRVFSELAVSR